MTKSIVTKDLERCFVCGSSLRLEMHHCIGGTANRKQSDKHGLTVPLCPDCHRGPKGVHHNKQLDLYIKRYAQMQLEKEFSYAEFMKVFGKNYR